MLELRIGSFILGFLLVNATISSAVRTFVLPRAAPDRLTRTVFQLVRRLFNLAVVQFKDYRRRDGIMALYAPVCLMTLTPTWLALISIGYAGMFWALGAETLLKAFSISGSSLLTLGMFPPEGIWETGLSLIEAATGMIMVALLIAYLPTIYSVFQRREGKVTALATRAGEPPWAVTLIERAHAISKFNAFHTQWQDWEIWFEEIEESHTSLSATVFFRSPNPSRSWITAAGCVLDTAALMRSTVDVPADPAADLMIRAGYLSLRSIARVYGFKVADDPRFPDQPISITRPEFDAAYDRLASAGVPLKPDREQCWLDFAGWRVNYDNTLLDICDLVMAPEAPWSGDRCVGRWYLTPKFKTPNRIVDAEELYRRKKEAELPSSIVGRKWPRPAHNPDV